MDSTFHNRVRDWVVDMPDIGFLFPAFIDRGTDIHNVLYYTKKPEELHDNFISNLLGTSLPITASEQKDVFQEIVTETLGDDCNYEMVKTIHDNLNEMIEQRKDSPEPLTLSKNTIKNLLTESGVSDEKMADFDAHYEKVTAAAAPPEQTSENPDDEPAIVVPREKSTVMYATNVANTKTFEVKTPDVVIKVNPERTDLVETMDIDGRKCIVIQISDQVEVNGIPINNN